MTIAPVSQESLEEQEGRGESRGRAWRTGERYIICPSPNFSAPSYAMKFPNLH